MNIRKNMTALEVTEILLLVLAFSIILNVGVPDTGDNPTLSNLATWGLLTAIALLAYLSYYVYIRVARAGGRTIDLIIWIVASFVTGSFTFWSWTVLDLNRFILRRTLYKGEAPIEYAWNTVSKARRKEWEAWRKAQKQEREQSIIKTI